LQKNDADEHGHCVLKQHYHHALQHHESAEKSENRHFATEKPAHAAFLITK